MGAKVALVHSLQFRIFILFLVLAIGPISLLLFEGRSITNNALTEKAYQSLQAAAQQTALRMDSFLSTRVATVAREARLPVVIDSLRPDIADHTPFRAELPRVLRSLVEQDRIFSTAAALLDLEGTAISETTVRGASAQAGDTTFFNRVMDTGLPLVSPVRFDSEGHAYVDFGAPVIHRDAPVGMLRLRFDAAALQDEIIRDTGRLGPDTFAVLFDENHFCLAHGARAPATHHPLLYQFPMAPAKVQQAQLMADGRLPSQRVGAAVMQPDLASGLASATQTWPHFLTQLPQHGDKVLAASVAKMNTLHWTVAFFQPSDTFLAPVEESGRQIAYQGLALVAAVLVLAMIAIRRLTRPIQGLTEAARKLGRGQLDVRARGESNDEIGSLARAFNGMAQALQHRIESQAFLARVSREIVTHSSDETEAAIGDIPGAIGEFFGASRVTLLTYGPPHRDTVEQAYQWPACDQARSLCPEVVAASWLRQHLADDGPVLLRDLPPEPWQAAGVAAILAIPLSQGSEHLGLLCLSSTTASPVWDTTEFQVLAVIAEVVARALQRQSADAQIRVLNEGLERRVAQRTHEFQEANVKLRVEIEERQRIQDERDAIHKQLYDVARRAGMAEVATTVLHNVGNALNSVGVSSFVLQEALAKLQLQRLQRVAEVLLSHGDDVPTYMATKQGKILPEYLSTLSSRLNEQRDDLLEEVGSLRKGLEHANTIVRAQQSFAGHSEAAETLQPSDLMEDAYSICGESFERNRITVTRDYVDAAAISVVRYRVVQILVNLLNNAKDAVIENPASDRRITMIIEMAKQMTERETGPVTEHTTEQATDDELVHFKIVDTGVGIDPAHHSQLFRYGFTTKESGHGFGLHGSALSAHALGGTLAFHSDGVGLGATFTLSIPCHAKSTDSTSSLDLLSSTAAPESVSHESLSHPTRAPASDAKESSSRPHSSIEDRGKRSVTNL